MLQILKFSRPCVFCVKLRWLKQTQAVDPGVRSACFHQQTFVTPFIIRGAQRERECFQPIREFFPRQVKFHQPQEKSKYLLLRLFPFSVCRPCGSERDAGPLDFSGVYRLLWER